MTLATLESLFTLKVERVCVLREVGIVLGRELNWRHLTGVTDAELMRCYLPDLLAASYSDGQPMFEPDEAQDYLCHMFLYRRSHD